MTYIAAVDESLRSRIYIVAAAVYEGRHRAAVDAMVRAGRRPEQQRIHFKAENDARRRMLLGSWVSSGLVRAWLYQDEFPGQTARDACLCALAQDAAKHGVSRLVIELGDPVRNRRDNRTIQPVLHTQGVEMAYSHERAGTHCGLELADGFAWAYGAGGEWRRAVLPITEVEWDGRL